MDVEDFTDGQLKEEYDKLKRELENRCKNGRETKRVYVFKETKDKIELWAKEHDEELPYIDKSRATFPVILELYLRRLK